MSYLQALCQRAKEVGAAEARHASRRELENKAREGIEGHHQRVRPRSSARRAGPRRAGPRAPVMLALVADALGAARRGGGVPAANSIPLEELVVVEA